MLLPHSIRLTLISLTLWSCRSEPSQSPFKSTPNPAASRPTIILWAWDRSEDLRFLKPGEAEIAALMATFQLGEGQVSVRPRRLPLLANPDVPIRSVIRFQSDGSPLPPIDRVTDRFFQFTGRNFTGLQIDFDARQSQLAWYGNLIYSLHAKPGLLRPSKSVGHLSITALASWCVTDPWFTGDRQVLRGSLDEVVPMLFRMGNNRAAVLNQLAAHHDFAPECRGAIGLTPDEPLPWHPPARRIYLFNPKRWTREAFDQACARFL